MMQEADNGSSGRCNSRCAPKKRNIFIEASIFCLWGQCYRRYLKEYHRIIYYNYLTAGTFYQHLAETYGRASKMFHRLVKEQTLQLTTSQTICETQSPI